MKTTRLYTRMIIGIIIVLAIFVVPGNVFSQTSTSVSVSPASSNATTCDIWEIAISVADVIDLTGYHLEIAFDPGYLDILEVRNGGFLDEGLYEVSNDFDNVAGSITFGMVQQNHLGNPLDPKDGSGDLIIIKMQALEEGHTVNFTIDPINSILVNWPDVQAIPFMVNNGSVTTQTCAPTDITLSNSIVAENLPVDTVVGDFSTTDPDTGDTFTYTLATGIGGTDNASFNISGNSLRTSEVFDYETKNNYMILVRSTDQGGSYFEKVFLITVLDELEEPFKLWFPLTFR